MGIRQDSFNHLRQPVIGAETRAREEARTPFKHTKQAHTFQMIGFEIEVIVVV